ITPTTIQPYAHNHTHTHKTHQLFPYIFPVPLPFSPRLPTIRLRHSCFASSSPISIHSLSLSVLLPLSPSSPLSIHSLSLSVFLPLPPSSFLSFLSLFSFLTLSLSFSLSLFLGTSLSFISEEHT